MHATHALQQPVLPHLDPSGAQAPCPVVGCTGIVQDAVFCRSCWRRLPGAVQRLSGSLAHAVTADSVPPVRKQYAETILRQAQLRLEAEKAGELSELERAQADQLAKILLGISSLRLVADTPDWWPKFDCTPWGCPSRETRALRERFASYYDREQASRGDKRRVTRTDCGGL
ncbi:MAG: hypothetical protein U1A78_41530 [Polyangia bacterium]